MKYLLLASALLLTTGVVSAEPTAYIGASLGQATMNTWCDDPYHVVTSCDDSPTTFKVFGGVRINPYFALEASVNHYGEYTGTTNLYAYPYFYPVDVNVQLGGFTGSAIGIIPVSEAFELFGKIGLVAWSGTVDVAVGGVGRTSYTEAGTGLLLGGGVNINLTPNVTLRAELEVFDLDTDTTNEDVTITTIMGGIVYNF